MGCVRVNQDRYAGTPGSHAGKVAWGERGRIENIRRLYGLGEVEISDFALMGTYLCSRVWRWI
jgi:hypothetical protein